MYKQVYGEKIMFNCYVCMYTGKSALVTSQEVENSWFNFRFILFVP